MARIMDICVDNKKVTIMRNAHLLRISLVLLVLGTSEDVSAQQDDDLDFLVGVSLGSTILSFDEKLDADAGFPTYTLFGSLSRGKWYGTLSYSDSLGNENVSEEDELGDANRNDLDVTFGYRFTPSWTGFVGYKDGETDIEFRVRDTDIVQNEFYRENGFYLGASYSFRFKRAGALSFSAAYIRFDSDLRFTEGLEEDDDDEEEDEAPEFDDLEGEFSSDADGYSLGVAWVMPLGKNLAFRTSYKINDYQLEVEDEGLTFEPDQQLRYFEIGLLYAF